MEDKVLIVIVFIVLVIVLVVLWSFGQRAKTDRPLRGDGTESGREIIMRFSDSQEGRLIYTRQDNTKSSVKVTSSFVGVRVGVWRYGISGTLETEYMNFEDLSGTSGKLEFSGGDGALPPMALYVDGENVFPFGESYVPVEKIGEKAFYLAFE